MSEEDKEIVRRLEELASKYIPAPAVDADGKGEGECQK